MDEKTKKNIYILSWILILILSIVLFRLVKIYDIFCHLLSVALPVIFGYIFAWILSPIFKKMTKKMDSRLAVSLMIALTILLYGLLIGCILPIIIDNASHLVTLVNGFLDSISDIPFLESLNDYKRIDVDVIIASCNNLISFLGVFGLVHIFGFYMLYNFDYINSYLRKLIPTKYRRSVLEYMRKLSTNMRLFIKGTLIDSIILFGISSILYLIIGLKYPIFLAFLSAITNIIPFIGPYIGGIPAVLVGLSSNLKLGILTFIAIVFAQTVESNIINPMIMSKCIKVNPLFIVIALTVMGKFFGLLGMVFAVPAVILLKLTIEFIRKNRLKKTSEQV